jgi:hypothetical protein
MLAERLLLALLVPRVRQNGLVSDKVRDKSFQTIVCSLHLPAPEGPVTIPSLLRSSGDKTLDTERWNAR